MHKTKNYNIWRPTGRKSKEKLILSKQTWEWILNKIDTGIDTIVIMQLTGYRDMYFQLTIITQKLIQQLLSYSLGQVENKTWGNEMLFVFNPFPNKPWFLHVCSKSFLKTLWEKEKLLWWAISPFPTVFSILLENFSSFSSNLQLLSANSCNLEESKICSLGKG